MPKAVAKLDLDGERFEDAIASLPQVYHSEGSGKGRHPRNYWHVDVTFGPHNDCYHMECVLGAGLAANFIDTTRRYPEQAESLIADTIKDMVSGGRLSGIEIAFIERLVAHFGVLPALTVIKARVPQRDGTSGIYQIE